jgi:hypothetical protein
VKTFCGWRDQQLSDGTVILSSPSGKTYVTTPGSALLFPSLCVPTGNLAGHETDSPIEYCGDRTSMMPRRSRTRRTVDSMSYLGPAPPSTDDDPPPF